MMAAANFPQCLAVILKSEGGFVLNDNTGVGATNLGVTQQTLSQWTGRTATVADVEALTVATVTPIYRAAYWNLVHGDDLPAGLDLIVFDESVNQGPSRAIRTLQQALSVAIDSAIGPKTLAAIAACNPAQMIDQIVSIRAALYRGDRLYSEYGKGWMNRLYSTAATAHSMVGTTPSTGAQPSPVTATGWPVNEVQPGVKVVPLPIPIPAEWTGPGAPAGDFSGAAPSLAIPPAPPPTALPAIPKAPVIVKQAPAAGAAAAATGALGLIANQALTSVNFSDLIDRDWPLVFAGVIAPLAVYAIIRALQLMHFNTTPAIQDVVTRGVALAGQDIQAYADAHPDIDVKNAKVAAAMNYVVNAIPDKLAQSGITQTQLLRLTQAKIAQVSQ
jgi:lysozyme family protein